MNKCQGCGAQLQIENKEEIGYTTKLESHLCERCFRIQHYGDYKTVMKENKDYISILKSVNQTGSLVLLVVDLFFLNENFTLFKETLKDSKVLLVLTKRDLLPDSIYENKLLQYMDRFEIPFIDKIIISKKNYHYDELMDLIQKYQTSKKVYVVGYTNAGKSTMINHMIYHYSNLNREITTSMLPSTTLNQIEIPLTDDLVLIDTPGILEEGTIFDYIDGKTIKRILPKKAVNPITYQVKKENSFWLDDLLIVSVEEPTNLTFFFSNSLRLERKFEKAKIEKCFQEHTLSMKQNEDIVITGLGFIKVSKSCKIKIQTLPNVKVYKRDSLI